MAVTVSFAGNTYSIPEDGESGWGEDLTDYLVALSKASVATTSQQAVRIATTSPITVSAASDYAVIVNVSGAAAVTFPSGVKGQIYAIIDGSGAAATNNITITGTGGQTLAGAATYVLAANYGAVAFIFDGSNWNLLSEVTLRVRGQLTVDQLSTNTSFVPAAVIASVAVASAADGESCTADFDGSNMIKFVVACSDGKAIECSASYASAIVNALSDPSGIFLATDAGTGIFVGKSATSATVTVKNRTGGSLDIEIKSLTNSLSSITAWS
jgi:hypothetical protein